MAWCGKPAAYVVHDLEGLSWFVCEAHGDEELPSLWIVRTPVAEWFAARGLPLPDRFCSADLNGPVFKCPDCGPTFVDEDGCCTQCGADAPAGELPPETGPVA